MLSNAVRGLALTRSYPVGISISRKALLSTTTAVDQQAELYLTYLPENNHIAVINLHSDKRKNALSKAMIAQFQDVIAQIKNNDQVRAVIVQSHVAKTFCAGADLKERLSMPDNEVAGFVGKLRDTFTSLSKIPVPVIAAIDGVALGGGLEIALACDIRLASETSTLGLPETALAIIPGAGGTQRLPRIVGEARAKELIFTGRRLTAQEAFTIGLVSEAVPNSVGVVARAKEIAYTIAEKGPVGIRMAKQAISEGMDLPLSAALEKEKECYGRLVDTLDRKEGLKAFTEKRKPQYQGK